MNSETLKLKWEDGEFILTSEIRDYLTSQCPEESKKLNSEEFEQIVRLCHTIYEANKYNYHPGNGLYAFLSNDLHTFLNMADEATLKGISLLKIFYQNVAKPFYYGK